MKVKDLVAQLQTLDPEMDVLVYSEEDDRFFGIMACDVHVYSLNGTTRNFRKVTPAGTTENFLCIV